MLALLVPAPAPARAQEGAFGEVIDVRVVNLEAVVSEQGERVTGLGPGDFRLTVDGEEVAIEFFTEVRGGAAVARGDASSGSAVPTLAPGGEVGTSYLLFLDELFSLPTDRGRVLQRIVEQLPSLSPADRMAVVAFDGERIARLSTWSRSLPVLERALEQALERPTHGLARRAEQRLFESTRVLRQETLDSLAMRESAAALEIEERLRADEIEAQVKRAVLAASSALRSFAGPPGRKVMLLLSGGWPYNPARWLLLDPAEAAAAALVEYGDRLYRPLIETANRLSYTLYPIDVPGLRSNQDVDATGFNARRGSAVPPAESAPDLVRYTEREREEEATLHALARATGGLALVDGAAASAFERVVEDTRTYYWIGFTPAWKGDDASHEVRVDTRRKGLEVRSRRSFSDLSRETEVTMMVESALLFGDPPGAASLGASIGRSGRAGRGKVWLPLQVIIPFDGLTLLPIAGGFMADAELRVAVLDADGNTSDIPVIPLDLRVAEIPEAGQVTVYEMSMQVRRKRHDLVVALYDKPSGTILSTRVAIDPQAKRR